MFPEPAEPTEGQSISGPDAQMLNDPASGPETLSVLAETEQTESEPPHGTEPEEPAFMPRAPVQLPDSIAHDALALETASERTWPRNLAWGMLNLALAAMLLGQLAYLFLDAWRVHALAGPWIERGCAWISCPPPGRNDLEQITTSDLNIRSQPESPGMLLVGLRLRNRAAFSQPLPVLEIDFIDVLGSTIESRRFAPEEYLPHYDPQADFLGAGVTEQIRLETPDPGEHAVNYMLRLHPVPRR